MMTVLVLPLLLVVGVLSWRFLHRAYLRDTTPKDDAAECGNCGGPVAPFMGVRDRPPFVYCNATCALDHAEDRQL